MGFFDRLFKGKEVFADRRNPDMVCEMTLCGQSHILSEFDIAYEPDNSSKEYMEAYAVFSEPVNAEVENWIMQSNRKTIVMTFPSVRMGGDEFELKR